MVWKNRVWTAGALLLCATFLFAGAGPQDKAKSAAERDQAVRNPDGSAATDAVTQEPAPTVEPGLDQVAPEAADPTDALIRDEQVLMPADEEPVMDIAPLTDEGAEALLSSIAGYMTAEEIAREYPELMEWMNRGETVFVGFPDSSGLNPDRSPFFCPGDSLFSQIPWLPTDSWQAGTADAAPSGGPYTRYDNYDITAGAVSRVRMWGINGINPGTGFTPCVKGNERFDIRFYNNVGGVPSGAPVCEYLGISPVSKTPTGDNYNTSFPLYEYDFVLPSACALTNGYMSIIGLDDGQSCWNLFMGSPDGDASNCLETPTDGIVCRAPDNDYDLGLCLSGTVDPGACCNQDTGTCVDTPPVDFFDCSTSGVNTRFIPNGTCGDFSPACGIDFGACCFDDGSCSELTDGDCAASNGFFSGNGTSCTPNECPQPCTCTTVINTFPFVEDFEATPVCATGFVSGCGQTCVLTSDWTQSTDHDTDWLVVASGFTGSSSTGPDGDSSPTPDAGNYAYTEASTCLESTAILESPCLDISGLTQPEFLFDYHMYGQTSGSISVEASDDSCLTWTPLFSIAGEQQLAEDEPYKTASISLAPYAGATSLKLRIVAVTGTDFYSDMAIDGLTVYDASGISGACCYPDVSCADGVLDTDCAAGGGVFQGAFSTCAGTTCGGACCLMDASCTQVFDQAECDSLSGMYEGDGTDCGPPSPCTGQCCYPDGSCMVQTEDACSNGGGVYTGDGTDCAVNDCPQPPPTNDTCATATDVVTVPFSDVVDNSLANADGPPGNGCNSSSATVMQNDVWWSYTPAENCALRLKVDPDFGGDAYDGIMQLYTGPDCNSLTPMSGLPGQDPGDEGCFDLTEPFETNFPATAGTTYWFQAGDWGTGAGGGITSFDLECTSGAFGACCLPDGMCVTAMDQADCDSQGGVYQGDQTFCVDAACPQPCGCTVGDTNYPLCTDFDTTGDFGGWTQNTADDDDDWTQNSGSTGSTGTGPSDDITGGGQYLYLEATGGSEGDRAILTSPCLDLTVLTNPELTLWYHMLGVNMGSLIVDVSTDDCLSWTNLATISGDQGDEWRFLAVDLTAYASEPIVSIRIIAERGPGFESDVAIDELCIAEFTPRAGACCDGVSCTDGLTQAACEGGGGTYVGDFTSCGPANPCSGACCFGDGSCADGSLDDCISSNGTFQGGGTDCATTFCPQPGETCDDNPPALTIPTTVNFDNSANTDDGPGASCDPFSVNPTMQNDQWYTVTSPIDCEVQVTITPTGYNAVGVVWEGPDCANLTEIGCFENGTANDAVIVGTFQALAGVTYYLQVGDSGAAANGGPTQVDLVCLLGACCYSRTGTCSDDVSEAACTGTGGVYGGHGSMCAPADCDSNGVSDFCAFLFGSVDCNGNEIPDECDIADGTSTDCDANIIPDDCEDDCNNNGVVDACDLDCGVGNCAACALSCGTEDDCQPDGIPDSCQLGASARAEACGGPIFDNGLADLVNGTRPAAGWTDAGVADDFDLVAGASTVGCIRVDMFDTVGSANLQTMRARIYPNPTGLVNLGSFAAAVPVYDQTFSVGDGTLTITDTGQDAFGFDNLRFEATGVPVDIGAGTFALHLMFPGTPAEGFWATSGADASDCAIIWGPTVDAPSDACSSSDFTQLSFTILEGIAGSDCNSNSVPDECDIRDCLDPLNDPNCSDCDGNGTIDGCEFTDCNENGTHDACDIAQGADDCDSNGVPDKCDPDCDANDIPDACEPDQTDCDNNGIIDLCDLAAGTAEDCQPDGIPDVCQLDSAPRAIVLTEGFESGVPPTGWTAVVQNASFTWKAGTVSPPEGVQYADVEYDPALVPQDEWLLSPTLEMTGNVTVAGQTQGSTYWGITPFDNYDVEVYAVVNGVGGGDDVFVGLLDNIWNPDNFVWKPFSYTFTAPDDPFEVGFRYVGSDGAQGSVDIVTVDGTIQMGPPANDCDDDGIPDDCQLCGDVDRDGDVDVDDYMAFQAAYASQEDDLNYSYCLDFDDDGVIGLLDYRAWLECYRDFIGNPLAGPPRLPRTGIRQERIDMGEPSVKPRIR